MVLIKDEDSSTNEFGDYVEETLGFVKGQTSSFLFEKCQERCEEDSEKRCPVLDLAGYAYALPLIVKSLPGTIEELEKLKKAMIFRYDEFEKNMTDQSLWDDIFKIFAGLSYRFSLASSEFLHLYRTHSKVRNLWDTINSSFKLLKKGYNSYNTNDSKESPEASSDTSTISEPSPKLGEEVCAPNIPQQDIKNHINTILGTTRKLIPKLTNIQNCIEQICHSPKNYLGRFNSNTIEIEDGQGRLEKSVEELVADSCICEGPN